MLQRTLNCFNIVAFCCFFNQNERLLTLLTLDTLTPITLIERA
ncbi:MAG: hypothetical protein PWK00_03415 [Coxiella burnetii]|nr:hypothetical protein [Coxiella burnetii]